VWFGNGGPWENESFLGENPTFPKGNMEAINCRVSAGAQINLSLSALGNVINALTEKTGSGWAERAEQLHSMEFLI